MLPVTRLRKKPAQKILKKMRSDETGSGRPTPTRRIATMNAEPADIPMPTLCRKRTSGNDSSDSDPAIHIENGRSCSHSKYEDILIPYGSTLSIRMISSGEKSSVPLMVQQGSPS